ncbi:His-Xaa-Ser system radical SAM maturase HxsB [Salinicola lusitanus]|uniref:His-Xaa-Ser system radical SAM maturase HxsB n=1 Tax=Salinicola lusitanus TaxID=1949085 RepID=UPI000DA2664C|nr:His-Xaa-Ser system radical SAM maturase HxsB [Salinicola lusitanus]
MSSIETTRSLGLIPFNFHRLDTNNIVAASISGDYIFLKQNELCTLLKKPDELSSKLKNQLEAKYFVAPEGRLKRSSLRLIQSRIISKKETVLGGVSLFIVVPTLQCEHTCQYCQVSRSLNDTNYSLSKKDVDKIAEAVFQTSSNAITIEFQGGDPLLRFDLIRYAIDEIDKKRSDSDKKIRFVITSTLHQLTAEMCEYFRAKDVYLSTSIDGPAWLHNVNRPIPGKNSFERTVEGIKLARDLIGADRVSALMTTTRKSLNYANEIVDEYIRLGFNEIFIRPLSLYGFANRNIKRLGYTVQDFLDFYDQAFNRVLYWNRQGVELREATASLIFNKILSPFDAGYVDLQSPNGAGLATLVFNYDGFVYPSDEARMLAETGDQSLRLGEIGEHLSHYRNHDVVKSIVASSLSAERDGCKQCAFNNYCGPDPVSEQAQNGFMGGNVLETDHCKRNKWFFDYFFKKLKNADPCDLDLAYQWAYPAS